MKLSKYLYISSILLSLTTLFSCVDDDLVEGRGDILGVVTLQGELSVPSASEVYTRAAKTDGTIDNITVLVFDNSNVGSNTEPRLIELGTGHLSSPADNTFTVQLTTRRGPTLLYVLANVDNTPLNKISASHPTLSEIRKLLTDSISGSNINGGYVSTPFSYPLTMSGKLSLSGGITSNTKINKTGFANGDPLPMVRSVAKFSIKIAASNFNLKGAALCGVSSAGRIISNQTDVDNVFDLPDNSPELLVKDRINYYNDQDKAFIFTTTNNSIDNIYAYETNAKDTESVKLLIFGDYTDTTTPGALPVEGYYLLGIIDGNNKDRNYDIVRNHHYQVTINSVSAIGAQSFKKAFDGPVVNGAAVNFSVTDNSVYNTSIFKDGYRFALDYDDVTLHADSLKNFTLTFLATDFDGSGKANKLKAESNTVKGKPTLYFANNSTESTLPVIEGEKTLKNYAISVNVDAGFTEGSVSVRLAGFEKTINLHKKRFRDLHNDTVVINHVLGIRILNNSGTGSNDWLTFSPYPLYIKGNQMIRLDNEKPSTVYVHLDENLQLAERYAEFEYVELKDQQYSKKKMVVGQVGTLKYDIGYWGGTMLNNDVNAANFRGRLLVEAYEEDENPASWVDAVKNPGYATHIGFLESNREDGAAATYELVRMGSPAAEICARKNRDENVNGIIDLDEMKWFLPTATQGVGISLYQMQVDNLKGSYWSSTVHTMEHQSNKNSAFALNTYKTIGMNIFPSINGNYGPQLTNAVIEYRTSWGTNHWERRYVRCVREL